MVEEKKKEAAGQVKNKKERAHQLCSSEGTGQKNTIFLFLSVAAAKKHNKRQGVVAFRLAPVLMIHWTLTNERLLRLVPFSTQKKKKGNTNPKKREIIKIKFWPEFFPSISAYGASQ